MKITLEMPEDVEIELEKLPPPKDVALEPMEHHFANSMDPSAVSAMVIAALVVGQRFSAVEILEWIRQGFLANLAKSRDKQATANKIESSVSINAGTPKWFLRIEAKLKTVKGKNPE